MADKYNIPEIERRLNNLVNTRGSLLMNLALLPKVVSTQPNTEDPIDKVIATEDKVISDGLITIRNYIRMYQELLKDYHSPHYMNFDGFDMNVISPSSYDTSTDTDDNRSVIEYSNYNGYFLDTVKNVLRMSQELRDGVKTLFVGENYDIKLDLVKDMVSPDTLVISGPGIQGSQVPFLPSVHRICIDSTTREPILIDLYTNTLTELYVGVERVTSSIVKLIETCPYLECIHLKFYTRHEVDVCTRIADALRTRREEDLSPIKSFSIRFVMRSISVDLNTLLDELQYHPLESLLLYLPFIGEFNTTTMMEKIVAVVEAMPNLQTLLINQKILKCSTIMKMLHGKIDNIISLNIGGRLNPKGVTYIENEVKKLVSIKNFLIGGNILSLPNNKEVEEHLIRNRKREFILHGEPELMQLLPNTMTHCDVFRRNDMLRMNAENEERDETIIDLIYTGDNEDDSDRPDFRHSKTTDSERRLQVIELLEQGSNMFRHEESEESEESSEE